MNFFNRLNKFSFKDSIAIAFFGVFFYFCFDRNVTMVSTLLPPIMLILGAYFAQEGYTHYLECTNGGTKNEQQTGTAESDTPNQGTPIS